MQETKCRLPDLPTGWLINMRKQMDSRCCATTTRISTVQTSLIGNPCTVFQPRLCESACIFQARLSCSCTNDESSSLSIPIQVYVCVFQRCRLAHRQQPSVHQQPFCHRQRFSTCERFHGTVRLSCKRMMDVAFFVCSFVLYS